MFKKTILPQQTDNRPPASEFHEMASGAFAPLKHKNDDPVSDIEYFYMIAERAQEMDAQNKTNLPTNYGKYDRDVVKVAKQVKEARDNNIPDSDIQYFIDLCMNI